MLSEGRIFKRFSEGRIIKLVSEGRIIKLLSEKRIIKLFSEGKNIKLLSEKRIIKLLKVFSSVLLKTVPGMSLSLLGACFQGNNPVLGKDFHIYCHP